MVTIKVMGHYGINDDNDNGKSKTEKASWYGMEWKWQWNCHEKTWDCDRIPGFIASFICTRHTQYWISMAQL
jgi:hypothetical protein